MTWAPIGANRHPANLMFSVGCVGNRIETRSLAGAGSPLCHRIGNATADILERKPVAAAQQRGDRIGQQFVDRGLLIAEITLHRERTRHPDAIAPGRAFLGATAHGRSGVLAVEAETNTAIGPIAGEDHLGETPQDRRRRSAAFLREDLVDRQVQ